MEIQKIKQHVLDSRQGLRSQAATEGLRVDDRGPSALLDNCGSRVSKCRLTLLFKAIH
jgi:hypothetical protein